MRQSAVLRYQLLGPLAVQRDGHHVELGPPKQRAVLAVLAQQPGVTVSTDRILDAVWGDQHPASVAASLQSYVSRLRRILRAEPGAPSPVARRSRGYVLDVDPSQLDVTDFLDACRSARAAVEQRDWPEAVRAGQHALDQWRGPYLADLADEDWVRVAAVPLTEQHQGVQQDLVAALLGVGDVPTALARAAVMSVQQPFVERAAWLHAVCLHRAGRTPEALALYDAFRRNLADELGLDVGPALRDLHAAILRQDPALATWPELPSDSAGRVGVAPGLPDNAVPGVVEPEPEPEAAPAVAPAATAPAASNELPLVGRAEQLAAIDAVLADARAGRTSWVVLRGQPGIGKTRLAQEAASRWTATGGRVVRASCPDDDAVPAWWPVRQILRTLGGDPDVVLTARPGADAVEFAVLEQARDAVLHAAHSGPPLLMLVDDVHWGDHASLQWLTFLADTVEQANLVVILTTRSAVTSPGLERLLAAAARRPGRQLAVPPLAAEQVADLVTQISGEQLSAVDAADLTARSGGNPFFASEFARLDPTERRRGTMPAAVSSVLRRRLSGLPSDLVDVLSAAAVLGDPMDVALLAQVTDRNLDDVGDLLDDAADRELLAPSLAGPSYTFAHALLRDEVLRALPAAQRGRLHLRAAEALGKSSSDSALAHRATHLRDAGPLADPREVYEAARAVATAADRDWQPDTAATWWDATLHAFERLPEQDPAQHRELVLARVAALTWAGRGQAVLEALDAGVLEALRDRRFEDVGTLAAHLIRVSGSWPWPVYGSDAAPLLATLRAVVPRLAADPGAQARVLAASAIGHCYDPDPAVPDTMSARAITLAEATGDQDVLADALLGRAMTYAGGARHARESIELLDRLRRLDHVFADIDEVLANNLLTSVHLVLGDLAACARDIEAGAMGADLMRLRLNRVQLRWAEAGIAQWHGDLDRAERLYARAELSHRQTELQQAGTFELAELILRWDQGRVAEMDGEVPSNPVVSAWTSAVVAAAKDRPGADAALDEEVHRDEPEVWTSHGRLTLLAHAVADRGLVPLAEPLYERLQPYAGYVASIGHAGAVGPVDLALARLRDLTGDRPGARAHLEQAAALASAAGGVPSQLRCRLLAATWAAEGHSDSPDLVEELRAVRAEAARRGMVGVVREVDDLLG